MSKPGKITDMVGKEFLYNANPVEIIDIKGNDDGTFRVHTDQKVFNVTKEELRKDFLPVEEEERQPTSGIELFHKNDGTGDLATILMGNIKKLQDDASFIDQSKAINETAKNIIELKKAQVEAFKAVRG
jgi:hypothetical protein